MRVGRGPQKASSKTRNMGNSDDVGYVVIFLVEKWIDKVMKTIRVCGRKTKH